MKKFFASGVPTGILCGLAIVCFAIGAASYERQGSQEWVSENGHYKVTMNVTDAGAVMTFHGPNGREDITLGTTRNNDSDSTQIKVRSPQSKRSVTLSGSPGFAGMLVHDGSASQSAHAGVVSERTGTYVVVRPEGWNTLTVVSSDGIERRRAASNEYLPVIQKHAKVDDEVAVRDR